MPSVSDDALADTFTLQGLRARQPRRPDGGFDWRWTGPRRDPEWAWFFNRHGWLPDLWNAWTTTGDPRYRDAVFATLADWLAANPPPGHITFSPAWRPLEAARRLLKAWLPLRDVLLADPACPPALRTAFDASLIEHGRHLRRHHAFGGNHLVTEMLALTRLALCLPGHPPAADWLAYALDRLERSFDDQVYPDGAYKELSSHYQRIITANYQQLPELLRAAGRHDLAARWSPRVELLWSYMRDIATPSGFNPLNNDSDREPFARLLREHAPALADAPPRGSVHFPWAGQTVFRDATQHQWGFFDAGPRGSDHDHADHLAFTLSLGSADFLVDNGRHTYAPGPWRDYFAGPAAHNILLLDQRAADQGPRTVSAPPRRPRFQRTKHGSLAWGDAVFSSPANPRQADWRRWVVHLPDQGWLVLDRVVAFAPAHLTTQWHWHPDCTLPARPDPQCGLVVRHHDARLHVRLLTTEPNGSTEQVAGRVAPLPQGWYSERFNRRQPAPALLHHQLIDRPVLNVWLFQPDGLPPFRVTIAPDGRVIVRQANGREMTVNHLNAELLASDALQAA